MKPEQLNLLRDIAERRNYGWGVEHAEQVNRIAVKIYDEFSRLGMLKEVAQDRELLNAAALLHDIGRPEEPHNVVAFEILREEIPRHTRSQPLSREELCIVLYCILFHRGHDFSERKEVPIADPGRTKRLAAILRVADGLDYGPPFDALVREVNLKILDDAIVCHMEPVSKEAKGQVELYTKHTSKDKIDLFREIFSQEIVFQVLDC